MPRTAGQTREHVLEVAHELFYWNGIRATGIDRVAASSGVAPTTLYRLFASKDDLIGAYMERAARQYRDWFDAAAQAGGAEPRQRILALFDALTEQVQPGQCRGCPFLMALAEFPDPGHPAHRSAVAIKQWTRTRLGELTADLPPVRPGDGVRAGGPVRPGDGVRAGGPVRPGDGVRAGGPVRPGDGVRAWDPGALADQLALVMEGVYASVQALGVTGPAQRARAFAEQLLGDPS